MGGASASALNEQLVQGARRGDADSLRCSLEAGVELNTLHGQKALELAVRGGHCEAVQVLARAGGSSSPVETPLHLAVRLGHYQLANVLLKDNLFPNDKNRRDACGQTPLHLAVQSGQCELVVLLLKYNAQPGLQNANGKTAKDLALECCVSELLEQFSAEDLLVRVPKASASAVSGKKTPLVKEPTSKSNVSLQDAETAAELLEGASRATNLPVIPGCELEFGTVINKGSSCVVLSGRWRGTEVAIKQFKVEYSEQDVGQFIGEMQVLAQVRHPHLLLLMGICIDQPNLCLVSELVPNCSLFQAIHRKKVKFSIQDKHRIAVQMTRGLAYLHSHSPQIIHRDLKPENCLLDHQLNVKIADFGLARPSEFFKREDSQTSVCLGTTRFMAPELFDREQLSSVGAKIDVWALGCTLINLYSGKRPWSHISGLNANCIYYEIFKCSPVPIPDNIPAGVRQIISKCCEYDPQLRPDSSQVLGMLLADTQLHLRTHLPLI